MYARMLTTIALMAALTIPLSASAKMMKKGPGLDLMQDCLLALDDETSTYTVIGGKRDGTWDTCCSKKLGYCISCNREANQCSKRSYRLYLQTRKPSAEVDQLVAPPQRTKPSPRPRASESPTLSK